MIIYIIHNNKLEKYLLPIEIGGNYWINYLNDSKERVNILNFSAENNSWIASPNTGYKLYYNGEEVEKCSITSNNFYFLRDIYTTETLTIFCASLEEPLLYFDITNNNEILIGNSAACNLVFNNTLIADIQAKIKKENNIYSIINTNLEKSSIFVNNTAITSEYILSHGDVIFIMGLKIILIGNILLVNNPANALMSNLSAFNKEYLIDETPEIADDEENVLVYKKSDYFNRAPRFRTKLETLEMQIDPPPNKSNDDDNPAILTVGPMMTMGVSSVVMLINSVNNAAQSGKGISSAIPQMIMSLAMLTTMLIWPTLTRKWNERKKYRNEIKRRDKYEQYIQKLRQEITKNITSQRQILLENHISVNDCEQIILNRNTKLWERRIEEDDFLVVRLGLGTVPLDIKIDYQKEGFTLEDDILREIVDNLIAEAHDITGAPVTVSLLEKRISGIVGNYNLSANFLQGLLLQLVTFYSADILKIVVFTNSANSHNWTWLKGLEHSWDNEKNNRFFAINADDVKEVSSFLDKEYELRCENEEGNNNSNQEDKYKKFPPYYFIICDDYSMIAENNFIKKMLKSTDNLGFSIVIVSDMISRLPNECTCFINVNNEVSGLIENELVSSKQKEFVNEYISKSNIEQCALRLANIPVLVESKSKGLPDGLGLLEMYNVGKVEGLNSASRWKQNDPTISLSAPIGVDANGDLFKLDLHEKFHGPHGLVAGTTGSGKSEWIITFILSMAINYSPNEVSFVIIDYKGGGLALAFENKELGVRLPHVAGTITNLDVSDLNRALASIEAELKRRQAEFNKARDISGESTIDIYKYQRLYREGIVKKPISHLFLISDEFAELKSQQPEFMDQLISTARIGRSLGVHLILATQKPSGVVNDQIWSNSKFKVCLKVQDKADSNDMIQVPDAAGLKQAGRFYLLVGYNDYFALGQSAYCGMPYIPSDTIKKAVDTTLNFVNNVGYVIKSVDDVKTVEKVSQGEVLLNVVKYLASIASKDNIKVDQLWLEKIPEIIYVKDLITKYNYQKEDYFINPVIGEYDDPSTQSQHLLTLPLSQKGNTLIMGMSGSGKEDLLASMIYSIITNYTTNEINLYIIDCGAETLKVFAKAPQVGDVMLSSEAEKVLNCIKMLMETLNERKKLFADYGGDISSYNKMSENKLPYILLIINNYDNYLESYGENEDLLTKLTREGEKYGIITNVTANSINSVKFRVKQNFSNNICLRLLDAFDYVSVFGSGSNKIVPSNNSGRGLIKEDKLYEFQSASICPVEEKIAFINELCTNLQQQLPKAKKVPVLPDVVDIKYLEDITPTLDSVPVAVEKASLKTIGFDLNENPISIIAAENLKNLTSFTSGFLQVISKIDIAKILVLDAVNTCKKNIENINYFTEEFKEVTEVINEFIESNKNNTTMNDCLIVLINGVDELLSNLDKEVSKNFTTSLMNIKKMKSIRIVLVDSAENLKKYAYEEWLKTLSKTNYGIWIGKGISEQSFLKTSGTNYKQLQMPLKNDMGYVIIDSNPIFSKVLEYYEEKEEEDIEVL